MKEWNKPTIFTLGVEETKYDCEQQGYEGTKDRHDHCPSCDESSSSCNCVPWTDIMPGNPTPGVS